MLGTSTFMGKCLLRAFSPALHIAALALSLLPTEAAAGRQRGRTVLLVSTANTLHWFTGDGHLRRSEPIPYPADSRPGTEVARDLVVGRRGAVHVYNGTFDPYLSTFFPRNGSWSHATTEGWSTVNNVSYGGIARYRGYIFVTDMATSDDAAGPAKGLLRYDTRTGAWLRFAETFDFTDVTLGQDGLLYALEGETQVHIFHPRTLEALGIITLGAPVRGVAAAEEGTLYGAGWDGNVYHFASDGAVLGSAATGATNLVDIDLSKSGQIAVSSRSGDVILLGMDLAVESAFKAGDTPTFVAFVGR